MKTLSTRLKFLSVFLTPNLWLATLTLFIGSVFLMPLLTQVWHFLLQSTGQFSGWKEIISTLGLLTLPQVMLGIAIVLMSIGLFLRARVAWTFTIILLIAISLFSFLMPNSSYHIGLLSVVDCLFLIWFWRVFNQSSLAAGTLFALVSFVSLLLYALCGSLYLGEEFRPVISELSDALYFSTVSMSTVGYGDIVPVTSTARLFTVSIIILGITVFATSISAIIGPMLGGNLRRMIKGRISHVMRKNHIIIIGTTPLAVSVYHGLCEQNEKVTVIVPPGIPHNYPENADVIVGDPSDNKALNSAEADKARYILVLRDDDSDNAFIVLAAKELVGSTTKIIALVNSDANLSKMKRVQPDIIFSLQTLAREMLLRKLNGEKTDNANLMDLLFQE